MVSEQTSESMRYLMRSNATHGSASFANIPGYYVGGKTGTADKIVHGHYSQDRVFTTFMAITPADKPKYLYLAVYDDPQAAPGDYGFHTAAWNAGRIAGALIRRVQPLEGVPPEKDAPTSRSPSSPAWAMEPTPTRSARSEATDERLGDIVDLDGADAALAARAVAGARLRQPQGQAGRRLLRARRREGRRPEARRRAVARARPRRRRARAPISPARRSSGSPTPALALARAAARLYPRQPETIVAVTGTSGKTSVAAFVRQIWQALGRESASLGTIGVVSRPLTVYGSLTTPDPLTLHRTLRPSSPSAGVTHLAMEASSHGLDQKRLDGVRLAAGAFTNLSRDHMDYHPTVEDYLAAKLRLFARPSAGGRAGGRRRRQPTSPRASSRRA